MRIAVRGSNLIERFALRVGLVPTPAVEAWGGMALSGVLIAATRLGVTSRLADRPATVAQLAAELELDLTATQLLVDCLRSIGHLTRRGSRYELSATARRWLDPRAELSVARFIEGNHDYWAWWSNLTDVVRTGQSFHHHDAAPDDLYWRRYVTGQFELARLSASEVAGKVRLPSGPRTLLDIGGGHGWYSVQLCRRHPSLVATVLDLPGSARIGREIVARSGVADRVSHREGSALTADLGGPYDLVMCFNLVHHLTSEQILGLFARIRAALTPGGSLVVMDAFATSARRAPAAAAFLGLFVYLGSGAGSYTRSQLSGWLDATGFHPPRRVAIRRIPGQALYRAAVRPG